MRLFALLPAALVAGCAGYAIDYARPKTSILAPELARYGFSASQSTCIGERLGASLSVWQLRQLQLSASAVTKGYADPGRLTPADLLWVARHAKDPTVGPEVARAAEGCNIGAAAIASARNAPAASAPPPSAPPPAPPAPAPAAVSASPVTWVNLGAAPTGQAIAVDATSLREEGAYRSGWFRLTNPGASGRSATAYSLRVDCAARTINPMAIRKFGPTGAVTEERDYGPSGEGALKVEGGTVMEIAYLALCT
jgi:hypothetical protein